MISAVSPRGELRFMVVRGGVGTRVFIHFLKRLLHVERRPVYLIVAGHSSRHSKKVNSYPPRITLRGLLARTRAGKKMSLTLWRITAHMRQLGMRWLPVE